MRVVPVATRRFRSVAAIVVVAFAMAALGCGESGSGNQGSATVTQTETVTTETETVTTEAAKPPKERSSPEAGSGGGGSRGGGSITAPDVVGMSHQGAQDALQEAGLYILDEEDATGQGRMLLYDRNWVVVEQDPPAGTRVSEDETITLRSKKRTDP